MKPEKCYYWLGFLVLLVSISMILIDLRTYESTNAVRIIENTLFVFIGLMLILIGELVKKLTVLETNLNNINKILFPDNTTDGSTPPPPERLIKVLNSPIYDKAPDTR